MSWQERSTRIWSLSTWSHRFTWTKSWSDDACASRRWSRRWTWYWNWSPRYWSGDTWSRLWSRHWCTRYGSGACIARHQAKVADGLLTASGSNGLAPSLTVLAPWRLRPSYRGRRGVRKEGLNLKLNSQGKKMYQQKKTGARERERFFQHPSFVVQCCCGLLLSDSLLSTKVWNEKFGSKGRHRHALHRGGGVAHFMGRRHINGGGGTSWGWHIRGVAPFMGFHGPAGVWHHWGWEAKVSWSLKPMEL